MYHLLNLLNGLDLNLMLLVCELEHLFYLYEHT
jgi:hypothetical protein